MPAEQIDARAILPREQAPGPPPRLDPSILTARGIDLETARKLATYCDRCGRQWRADDAAWSAVDGRAYCAPCTASASESRKRPERPGRSSPVRVGDPGSPAQLALGEPAGIGREHPTLTRGNQPTGGPSMSTRDEQLHEFLAALRDYGATPAEIEQLSHSTDLQDVVDEVALAHDLLASLRGSPDLCRDATTEVKLRVCITVRVRGERMTDDELAAALGPYGQARKLEHVVEDALHLDAAHTGDELGWTPDGNRAAYIDELVSVDSVEEITR
jgi:hypothetical protein